MSVRSTLSRLRCLVPALLALSVVACVPPIDRPEIGRLRVVGPEVTVDGTPAVDGMTIRSGNKLATGGASSAYVDLAGGGVVQLDENTDPFFERIVERGRCLFMVIVGSFGRLFVQTSERDGGCPVMLVSSNQRTQVGSSVHLDFSPRRDVLTLIEGRAHLIEPETIELAPQEQVTVAEGRVVDLRRISPAEIRGILAWRERFPRPPPLVRVPPLRAMPLDAARRQLALADLQLGRVTERESVQAAGTVIDQVPPPGATVRLGSRVDVTIARAPPRPPETRVSVPNLQGLTLDAARVALREAGLQLGRQDIVRPLEGPPYYVIGQHPAFGTRVPTGTAVDLRLEGSIR